MQLVAAPETFHVRVPVRFPELPKTVAVKVSGVPSVVVPTGESVRLTVGVADARLIGRVAEVAVR